MVKFADLSVLSVKVEKPLHGNLVPNNEEPDVCAKFLLESYCRLIPALIRGFDFKDPQF